MTMREPDSPETVREWVRKRMRAGDRFARVYDASERHREEHGGTCTVYPSGSGPLLGTLAAAAQPDRVLEVGCGLGYSALLLADGAGAQARVETIEHDPLHAESARAEIEREGFASRIRVLDGRAAEVLPKLEPGYAFIFWDGDPEQCLAAFEQFMRLLARGGVLVTSNLFLAQYDPGMPGIAEAAAYRERLLRERPLRTAFTPGGLAISVRD